MCSLLAENTNGIVRKHVISTIYYYMYTEFFVTLKKDSKLSIVNPISFAFVTMLKSEFIYLLKYL